MIATHKKPIERLWSPTKRKGQNLKSYSIDTLLAAVLALLMTGCIFALRLYPSIPDISLLYLLIVLGLAIVRGRYAAVASCIVAFLSFDYFLVPPIYTFSILKFEEWLALFVFLVTAIITGQLASALWQRAEDASRRESETRALYELVRATTAEEQVKDKLTVVARAIVKNFAASGVVACAILLPDRSGMPLVQASAGEVMSEPRLGPDEEAVAVQVMKRGQVVDIYPEAQVVGADRGPYYQRLIPLQIGAESVGVVWLCLKHDLHKFPIEQSPGMEQERLHPRTTFFWSFLDQAASIIERERLRKETLKVELLRRTDELRSALLSSVSHDLRTPLSSIKAAASSLLQEDVQWDEEERRSFASTIEREADRLNRLVGNLLDMSRIEGGALRPEKEWFPLDELIHDVVDRMRDTLSGRQVRTSIPDDLPPVSIDYLQMDQVLTNLLENANRYTPVGSPIDIRVEVVGKEIIVSIEDRGPGIAPQDRERIFDKFYRVLGTQRKGTEGSGLGLAVCRGLIEAHGGRIWVEKREGGGARFRFSLPIPTELQGRDRFIVSAGQD